MAEHVTIEKKIEAKNLYVVQGHCVAYISRELIISAKAIHRWIRLYGWSNCAHNNFNKACDTRFEEFLDYLKDADRAFYNKAIVHLEQYSLSKKSI